VMYGHVNPGGRGVGGFSEFVQEASRRGGSVLFANLVDVEAIRKAAREFMAVFGDERGDARWKRTGRSLSGSRR